VTSDREPFDELYARDADPWRVRTDWYERRKLAVVLSCLPREHYATGLEIGCSIGVTTRALAGRCGHLEALDASPRALELARQELADLPAGRVSLVEAAVPEQLPAGPYDLVVLSEVGYFIPPARVDALATALPGRLTVGGDLVAVHWRLDADRLATAGDVVHERLGAQGLTEVVGHVEREFVLQVWRRDA